MKRVLTILLTIISLFMIYDNTYATEGKRVIFDEYTISVSFDDEEDAVIVEESFVAKSVPDGYDFSKEIYSEIYDFDSNYMIAPNYKVTYDPYNIEYMVHFTEGETYYAKYKIKDKTVYKGDKYKINIKAPGCYGCTIDYKNFSFVIASTEENPVYIKDLVVESPNDFVIDEDGKTITGYINGDVFYSPSIEFEKESHYEKPISISNYSFYIILVIASALIFISLLKMITGNKVYDYMIIGLSVAEALIYFVSKAADNIHSVSEIPFIIPLGFCAVLYSAFFIGLFFKKSDKNYNKGQKAAEALAMTFAKLFVVVHSLVMISAVVNINVMNEMSSSYSLFDFENCLDLVLIEVSIFIASYAYQYFDRKTDF